MTLYADELATQNEIMNKDEAGVTSDAEPTKKTSNPEDEGGVEKEDDEDIEVFRGAPPSKPHHPGKVGLNPTSVGLGHTHGIQKTNQKIRPHLSHQEEIPVPRFKISSVKLKGVHGLTNHGNYIQTQQKLPVAKIIKRPTVKPSVPMRDPIPVGPYQSVVSSTPCGSYVPLRDFPGLSPLSETAKGLKKMALKRLRHQHPLPFKLSQKLPLSKIKEDEKEVKNKCSPDDCYGSVRNSTGLERTVPTNLTDWFAGLSPVERTTRTRQGKKPPSQPVDKETDFAPSSISRGQQEQIKRREEEQRGRNKDMPAGDNKGKITAMTYDVRSGLDKKESEGERRGRLSSIKERLPESHDATSAPSQNKKEEEVKADQNSEAQKQDEENFEGVVKEDPASADVFFTPPQNEHRESTPTPLKASSNAEIGSGDDLVPVPPRRPRRKCYGKPTKRTVAEKLFDDAFGRKDTAREPLWMKTEFFKEERREEVGKPSKITSTPLNQNVDEPESPQVSGIHPSRSGQNCSSDFGGRVPDRLVNSQEIVAETPDISRNKHSPLLMQKFDSDESLLGILDLDSSKATFGFLDDGAEI